MAVFNNNCCDPRSRLPKKLSCLDCVNLIRYQCQYLCRMTGEMIPFPNLYVCGFYQTGGRRGPCKCCTDEGCPDTTSNTQCNDSDCCNSGLSLHSCHQDGQSEKEDIWCHNRCSTRNDNNLCRVCCGDDCATPQPGASCKCCQTIQQRLNF